MKKKLNRNQRARRASGFSAMRPRGRNAPQPSPHNPFRYLFPIEDPVPITQLHARPKPDGGVALKPIVATTVIPLRDADGNLKRDANGRPIPKRVPVCRHRCTHINMRHGSKAERAA